VAAQSLEPRRAVIWILIAIVVALLLPFISSGFVLRLATIAGLLAIAAIGLNILMGFTGQISLVQAGLYGVGAYVSAILTRNQGFPVWPSIFIGAFSAGIFAIGIGLIAFRTKGVYFIISSLAAQLVASEVFINWAPVTGGEQGIARIPAPEGLAIPGLITLSFADRVNYYHLVLTCLAAVLFLAYRLRASSLGRLFFAVREDETLARSMGVNVTLVKSVSFFIAAAVTGFAGALYAHYESFINPDSFTWLGSADLFIFVLLGGSGTTLGPIVGTFLLYPLPEILRVAAQFRLIVYALILLAVAILMPKGIIGTLSTGKAEAPSILGRKRGPPQPPR